MDIEKIGKAISFLRKRAGYTQKDLAERIGVSDKAISKWERGLGLPDISCLRRLSILLDTDTDSLLAGDVVHHGSGWNGLLILDENREGVTLGTPIYDKPLVYSLLSYFMLVGIKDILILCAKQDTEYLKSNLGDGSQLGIRLRYGCGSLIESLEQEGDFAHCKNYMVVYGRSFIYGVDQTRFFQKAMLFEDRLTVLSLPKGMKQSLEKIRFNSDRKIIISDGEEELSTQYDYYDIPVLFCPSDMILDICPDRTVVNSLMVPEEKNLCVYTHVLDRGFVEINLDSWEGVLAASEFVRVVQQACGMKLYCIEEIAWRRGMISHEELKARGMALKESEYGKYILSLFRGE